MTLTRKQNFRLVTWDGIADSSAQSSAFHWPVDGLRLRILFVCTEKEKKKGVSQTPHQQSAFHTTATVSGSFSSFRMIHLFGTPLF